MMGNMEDPTVHYNEAKKLIAHIEFQLQQFEDETLIQSKDLGILEEEKSNLAENLNILAQASTRLTNAVSSMNIESRDLWHRRAEQIAAETAILRKSTVRLLSTDYNKRRQKLERESLIDISVGKAERTILEAQMQERQSLESSHRMIDEVYATATTAISSLRDQKHVMKGIHRRVLDVTQRLGLSASLIQIINRKTKGDKVLVYGGSCLILLLIFLLWWLV